MMDIICCNIFNSQAVFITKKKIKEVSLSKYVHRPSLGGAFCFPRIDLAHTHSRFMFSLCFPKTEKAPTNFFVSA